MKKNFVDNGPMLNAYPDSMGGTMADIVSVLSKNSGKCYSVKNAPILVRQP